MSHQWKYLNKFFFLPISSFFLSTMFYPLEIVVFQDWKKKIIYKFIFEESKTSQRQSFRSAWKNLLTRLFKAIHLIANISYFSIFLQKKVWKAINCLKTHLVDEKLKRQKNFSLLFWLLSYNCIVASFIRSHLWCQYIFFIN